VEDGLGKTALFGTADADRILAQLHEAGFVVVSGPEREGLHAAVHHREAQIAKLETDLVVTLGRRVASL
jgi:hypothetical protein